MTKTETAKPTEPEQDVFAGSEDVEFDESDRATGTNAPGTPYYAIAQSQGKNAEKIKHAGQFFVKDEEGKLQFFSDLQVIILESGPQSTRFTDDDNVACRSYDGRTGQSGQLCKDCKWNFFRENEIPKTDKCKNAIRFLCLPADNPDAEPFFVQINPSGIKDWKKYAFWLQNTKKRPVFSCVRS